MNQLIDNVRLILDKSKSTINPTVTPKAKTKWGLCRCCYRSSINPPVECVCGGTIDTSDQAQIDVDVLFSGGLVDGNSRLNGWSPNGVNARMDALTKQRLVHHRGTNKQATKNA